MSRKFQFNRGEYGGMSGPQVARMLGKSHRQTHRILKQLKVELNREISPEDIGDLILEYRKKSLNINYYLDNINWVKDTMATPRKHPELHNYEWVASKLDKNGEYKLSPEELADEIGCNASSVHWIIERYFTDEQRANVNYKRRSRKYGQ